MRHAPVLAVIIASLSAAAADVAPPPRGTWVVDNAGVLTTEAIDRLNTLATTIDSNGTAQLGVAIVNTTSGVAPRTYATISAGQNKEEVLGSVSFDVWWCARCRDTEITRRDSILTRYKPCSSCGHKTALETDGHTLTYATTISEGEVEVIETCKHCDNVARYTRTTPRIQETVTAVYESSSSSSSSFSDSFSSSSSSSDSSFGGGSSDGGGSSGGW